MKHILKIASFLSVLSAVMMLSSCKKEEDDLATPVSLVSFVNESIEVDEAAGTVKATLFLQAPGPVTVNYTVGGTAPASDFTIANSGTITVPEAGKATSIEIQLNNNTTLDGSRTIVLTLTGASNGVGIGFNGKGKECTITISDEDKNVFFGAGAVVNASELPSQVNLIKIPVRLNAPSTLSDITVNYNIAEDNGISALDYQIVGVPGQVVIPQDSTQAFVEIQVLDDQLLEMNESLTLTITGVVSPDAEVGVAAQNTEVTVNVVDDVKAVEIDPSVSLVQPENTNFIIVPIKLSEAPLGLVTVNYTLGGTALVGVDYLDITGGALVIPAGVEMAFISLQIIDDADQEGNETIDITLLPPISADGEVIAGTNMNTILQIEDND